MSQQIIRATLMTALATYAAAHSPVLTVARENVPFVKPTSGATFLEAFLIPANTITPTVAGQRRRFLGDLQINVWAKEGQGAGVAETIAEEISQLFPVMPKSYLPVSIEMPARIRRPVTDTSGWYVLPILVSYRMEAEN